MTFIETPRFPTEISKRSQGGPGYNTTIVEVRSGHEARNINWSMPRHKYNVGYGIRDIDDQEELAEYFHAVGGMGNGFRYKDWLDFKSCNTADTVSATDQLIGTGDGAETEFQLVKVYTKGALSRTRNIAKPVSGTVKIAIDDVEKAQGDGTYPWSVDTTTGIVTFSSNPPPDTESVKAGYEFDVPVRFDVDDLMFTLMTSGAGKSFAAVQVPIIEIRDIA